MDYLNIKLTNLKCHREFFDQCFFNEKIKKIARPGFFHCFLLLWRDGKERIKEAKGENMKLLKQRGLEFHINPDLFLFD